MKDLAIKVLHEIELHFGETMKPGALENDLMLQDSLAEFLDNNIEKVPEGECHCNCTLCTMSTHK